MLKLKLLFLLFSSIFTFHIISFEESSTPNLLASPEEVKSKIMSALRKEAAKYRYNYPSGYYNIMTNLASTTSIKMDQIFYNQIDRLTYSHGFPPDVVNKIKKIKYVQNTLVYDSFSFSNSKSSTNLQSIFGIGARIDSQYLYVVYVKGESSAKSIQQYKTVRTKKCKGWWIFKSCKYVNERVTRGFTTAELDKMKQALKAKYAETMNNVLDLEQQKMIDKFKSYANEVKKQLPYPSNYARFIVDSKTTLDFKTVTYGNPYPPVFSSDIQSDIRSIQNKPNSIKPFFYTNGAKSNPKALYFMIGVIYNNAQNKVTVSYAYGTGSVKLYHGYCDQVFQCLVDIECTINCNNFKKKYKNIENPLNPKLNAQVRQKNIENIQNYVYAELINSVVKTLNGIVFK